MNTQELLGRAYVAAQFGDFGRCYDLLGRALVASWSECPGRSPKIVAARDAIRAMLTGNHRPLPV